jgi:gliding motility-associated-like protein
LGWQSIAGCYYVTALDSLNLWPDGLLHQNESDPSNTLCVDNCPEYSLPNVITPDLDGINDVFIPFPYRSIKDIDLKIYNRYGTLVFETTDRDINWNGSDQKSGELCSDGVYYYTVTINTIRLHGIIAVNEEGYIQLLNATNPTPQH